MKLAFAPALFALNSQRFFGVCEALAKLDGTAQNSVHFHVISEREERKAGVSAWFVDAFSDPGAMQENDVVCDLEMVDDSRLTAGDDAVADLR